MLDRDLARLYGVTTGALNQAVRRNSNRFPDDFMFKLTRREVQALKSQIVISNGGKGRSGGRRHLPNAFTEHGVAMLSSVLNSERAIAVNILVMRAFVRIRAALAESSELRVRIDELERRLKDHGILIAEIVEALDALRQLPSVQRAPIGFRPRPRGPRARAPR